MKKYESNFLFKYNKKEKTQADSRKKTEKVIRNLLNLQKSNWTYNRHQEILKLQKSLKF